MWKNKSAFSAHAYLDERDGLGVDGIPGQGLNIRQAGLNAYIKSFNLEALPLLTQEEAVTILMPQAAGGDQASNFFSVEIHP